MNKHRATVVTVDVSEKARIRAQVLYNPGGWDGSRATPRGYELSVWPETLSVVGGVTFAHYSAGSGRLIRLEATTRFSQHRFQTLATELTNDPRLQEALAFCRTYLDREGLA